MTLIDLFSLAQQHLQGSTRILSRGDFEDLFVKDSLIPVIVDGFYHPATILREKTPSEVRYSLTWRIPNGLIVNVALNRNLIHAHGMYYLTGINTYHISERK